MGKYVKAIYDQERVAVLKAIWLRVMSGTKLGEAWGNAARWHPWLKYSRTKRDRHRILEDAGFPMPGRNVQNMLKETRNTLGNLRRQLGVPSGLIVWALIRISGSEVARIDEELNKVLTPFDRAELNRQANLVGTSWQRYCSKDKDRMRMPPLAALPTWRRKEDDATDGQ